MAGCNMRQQYLENLYTYPDNAELQTSDFLQDMNKSGGQECEKCRREIF